MFILWEYVYQGKNNYVAKHTWKNLLVVGSVWGVAVDSAVEAVIVDETDCTVAAVGGCVAPRSTVNIYNVIKDFY